MTVITKIEEGVGVFKNHYQTPEGLWHHNDEKDEDHIYNLMQEALLKVAIKKLQNSIKPSLSV